MSCLVNIIIVYRVLGLDGMWFITDLHEDLVIMSDAVAIWAL